MAEPLVRQWFAIFPLLPPAMAPMFVANSHLKILRSFVESSKMHAQAVANPAFAGGPFVNVPVERLPDVKALLDRTEREARPLIEFAQAVKELDALLQTEARGGSLEPLYERIPEPLRGYVELNYNLAHSASYRFFEGLLYESRYYQESAQSWMLRLTRDDRRPFVMSTPRLEGPDSVHIAKPLRDETMRRLFAMRDAPADPRDLYEPLGIPSSSRELFDSFFTEEPPQRPERYDGPGVRVRFFGHACVLLESREATILIDPLVSYRYPSELARFDYSDLPPVIDYVLLTHIHADHVVPEVLLQLRHKIKTVITPRASGNGFVDASVKWMLSKLGFSDVRELDEFERIEIQGGAITGMPFLGEHCDLDIRSKIAHFIELSGKTFLAATDSNALEPRIYERCHERLGKLDMLLLGTESAGAAISYGYGNLFSRPIPREIDQTRRQNGSNARSAIEIIERLRPASVQNYAMGLEPWLKHLFPVMYSDKSPQIIESNKLLEYCRQQGIPHHRPYGKHEVSVA